MKDDNFELEELMVPDNDIIKNKYEAEVAGDVFDDEIIHDGDVNVADLSAANLTFEKLKQIAKEQGKKAALEYVDYLKKHSKTENNNQDPHINDNDDRKEINAYNVDSNENNLNEIDLSTSTFISPLTNECVDLRRMSTFAKVSEIYYHTSKTISLNDPVLLKGYNRGVGSFKGFLSSLDSYTIKRIQKSFGSNWYQMLIDDYTEAWNGIIKDEIGKEKDKASDRLREDLKNEKIKSEQLGKRVNELGVSLSNETRKNSLLMTKVDMLENSNIDLSLEQLHNAKEDLKREKEQLLRPNFVTDRDSNVYDYVVSKADDVPKTRK